MSTFTFYTAIIFFSLLSFIIGGIYTNIKNKKLNERIDKEIRGINRQLGLLNNTVYGNVKNNCKGSIERRLAEVELNMDKHSDLLNEHMDAINKLARHTEYPKSKIV